MGNLVKETNGNRVHSVTQIPAVDISENDNEFIVEAEVPGATKDKIEVELQKDILEVKAQAEIDGRAIAYHRRFKVGQAVKEDGIEAHYQNGVLRLVLPKAESQKPRRIEVAG